MFPWDQDLYAYKTIDSLLTLSKALDLTENDLKLYHSICFAHHLERDGTFRKAFENDVRYKDLPYIPLLDDEYEEMKISALREACWMAMQIRREKRKLEKLIFADSGNKHWFVTINLDDKLFSDKVDEAFVINPLVKKIITTPGFENVKFVVEKFRKNEAGQIYIHRHIHMVFDCELRKSKIIQYVFQKTQKYVQSKNFIDVKPDPDCKRDKYILGDKVQAKMECVAKDRSWRKEKKIIECE